MAEPKNYIKERQDATKVDNTNVQARLFMDQPAKKGNLEVKGSPK